MVEVRGGRDEIGVFGAKYRYLLMPVTVRDRSFLFQAPDPRLQATQVGALVMMVSNIGWRAIRGATCELWKTWMVLVQQSSIIGLTACKHPVLLALVGAKNDVGMI